ncbi:MAG: hypothetical protein AAF734_07270, partial [Bacteroidota bacterium]
DDSLEMIRQKNYPNADRSGIGQFKIAEHFGYKYKGLEQNTEQSFPTFEQSTNYDWYAQNILPILRSGEAITIGIIDKTDSNNGHIVHLLGVTEQGLYVHEPMGNTYWEGLTYHQVMYTNANPENKTSPPKGKNILWTFERIKKSPIMRINWIRKTEKN